MCKGMELTVDEKQKITELLHILEIQKDLKYLVNWDLQKKKKKKKKKNPRQASLKNINFLMSNWAKGIHEN